MGIKTGLDNKRVAINIFFSCIAFITNAFISLFITPYITESLGAEAYGFVKLANDFASYGSLVTLALNAMASRFIMIQVEKKDDKCARSYYSSITIANILISLVLFIPTVLIVVGINRIFDVPDYLLTSVRWAFVWTLSNFLICLAGTTFGNCFFIRNRLDISSILTSVTSIIRAVFIVTAFAIKGPDISIMAFGSIVVTAVFLPANIYFHKKLTPELYFDAKSFDFSKIWEVLSSSIWSAITRLSGILTTGLDLTVTNILLGSLEMGYLSVAKTIPNFISALNSTIGTSFTPNLMQIYVVEDKVNLKRAVKTSMRIMSVFSTIPNAILISMGVAFYRLWVPNQPAELINLLSVITVIGTCVLGPIQPIYQIFIMVNRIKESSIVLIIEGFVSISVTYIFVHYLGFGLYAVAGVSVALSIVTALVYHLPMGARYLDLPWSSFYPEIGKNILVLIVQCAVGYLICFIVPISSSWIMWFAGGTLLGVIGLVITMLGILDKDERKELIDMLLRRVIRKRK